MSDDDACLAHLNSEVTREGGSDVDGDGRRLDWTQGTTLKFYARSSGDRSRGRDRDRGVGWKSALPASSSSPLSPLCPALS